MGILDIGLTTHNKYQEISGQAKIDLTNEVIDLMSNHISGTQLLTLNKVLESTLEKYEVFIDNKIDVNELNEFIDLVNSICVKLNLFRNVIVANPCCYEGLRDELVDALKVELFEGDIEDVKE